MERQSILSVQYGSQILPLPKETENAMKYQPDKGFQVIGVVPKDSVPQSLYTKVCMHLYLTTAMIVLPLEHQHGCTCPNRFRPYSERAVQVAVCF